MLPPIKDLFESEKFESEKFVFRVAGVFTGVCVAEQRLFNQPDTPDDCVVLVAILVGTQLPPPQTTPQCRVH